MGATRVPAAEGRGEHEDRGSRFLAVVFAIGDEEDFRARLERERAAHPKARHHCWAWRLGETCRFSDDGEPGGTAGRPMLQALDAAGYDAAGAVCTRWFGGVKLGTGGLARAYRAACARAAQDAGLRLLRARRDFRLALPFDRTGLRDELETACPGARFRGEFTAEGWSGVLTVDEEQAPLLREILREKARPPASWSEAGA